ncbi:MAG: dihydroorotate dehydrogenase [Patescibacteria group bacterium]|jgi:dihydroorotate dehydrogenase (NAD+) catalytic subunit
MAKLSCEISGIALRNPLILASGILGVTKASLGFVVRNGAGAVTIKSISYEEREGHPGPNMIMYEGGMINAVGYSNPGVLNAAKEFTDLSSVGAPVIASIIGTEADDFVRVAEQLLPGDFAAVELPLSCPHTPGYGTMAGQQTPEATSKITKAVKAVTDLPIWVKLSPMSESIGEVAKAAEDAGASALTAVNTMGPGMIIDPATCKPVMGFGRGGVSGAALRPIAIQTVFDVYRAVKIPIVGTGGVETGRHAIEMLLAGASALGVGTAVLTRGVDAFQKIADELSELMDEYGYTSIKDIIGKAHEAV